MPHRGKAIPDESYGHFNRTSRDVEQPISESLVNLTLREGSEDHLGFLELIGRRETQAYIPWARRHSMATVGTHRPGLD
jgi:hypothetical protein